MGRFRIRNLLLSGMSSRTLNKEIFEEEFAIAGIEWAAAAKARYFALGR
jgi:hypothetical protein